MDMPASCPLQRLQAGWTPLHIASAHSDHLEAAQALVLAGASVDTTDVVRCVALRCQGV